MHTYHSYRVWKGIAQEAYLTYSMTANLKISSINVRGLGNQHKRRDVMKYLKDMNYDIIFLQDTHLVEEKLASSIHCGMAKRTTRAIRIIAEALQF